MKVDPKRGRCRQTCYRALFSHASHAVFATVDAGLVVMAESYSIVAVLVILLMLSSLI